MFDPSDVTALIPAYNAAATIRRAIHSVRDQVGTIIVLDDGSGDDTVSLIRDMGVPHLTLLRSKNNRGIGASREQLINACESRVAVWLDADDEFLPGRVERLLAFIEAGAEWVFDAATLCDGNTGQFVRELPIPAEITSDDGILWELARNYIPSLGWAMVRTASAQAIGYDSDLRQAEDYDHLLRAIFAGGDIRFCTIPGYKHYHYATSASRNLDSQTRCAERALERLNFSEVAARLEASQLSPSDKLAIYAYYYCRLKQWEKLYRLTVNYCKANWEMAFFKGVACYYQPRMDEAIGAFEQSLAIRPNAAAYNNLGVCISEAGDREGARQYFEEALKLFPQYYDAFHNIEANETQLTHFPVREAPIREQYR